MSTNRIITPNETHFMIDIETLGTRPGCIILQIGAIKFNSKKIIENLIVGISLEDSVHCDFIAQKDTVDWWGTQDQELYKEVAGGSTGVAEALYYLNDFVGTDSVCWSKWSHFDFPILQEAYYRMDVEFNVSYRNRRCYATLTKLFTEVEFIPPTKAHDALEDARAQAKHLIMINKYLGEQL